MATVDKPRTIIVTNAQINEAIDDLTAALEPWEEGEVDEEDVVAVQIATLRKALKLILAICGRQESLDV